MSDTTHATRGGSQDHATRGTSATRYVDQPSTNEEYARYLAARANNAAPLDFDAWPSADPRITDRDAEEFRQELRADGFPARYNGYAWLTDEEYAESILDKAAESGDPDAIARQEALNLYREAALRLGLADLGLDPTPRLRHFIDIDDPYSLEGQGTLDYGGLHVVGEADPYYR